MQKNLHVHCTCAKCAKSIESTITDRHPQRGAGLIEYALLVALVSVISIGAMRGVGVAVEDRFRKAKDELAGGAYVPECSPGTPDWPSCL
jgi:Flp pilus assembly pilin Flp